MKLLLLLSLIILAWGDRALVAEKTAENNDISLQASTVLQAQPSIQEILEGKKLGKRSLLPLDYVGTYAPVLPWYRLGGLSSYKLRGWYPGWSLHGGWQSGWYKGW
ncbi:uncharacterized protein LOC114940408 [Nylanderia fulva]|uniref:uncharacterized protein LOC114940408 n=1 Tax=Nylanderia fulva TaxID=613905 RepID=UPI0010FB246E|nr:uncharacterized protein LOC114940408 [Nylanderia fulva]